MITQDLTLKNKKKKNSEQWFNILIVIKNGKTGIE